MTVFLATLCLNEMEWLPKLYEQHRDWPGLTKWVFVEAADREYARHDPEMVSSDGLSVDGTTEYLEKLARDDPRVVYIRHGFSTHEDPAKGKCESRQRYVEVAHTVRPDFLISLDADEFYTRNHQTLLIERMVESPPERVSWIFPRREIWHPPIMKRAEQPLFDLEVVGGFWAIPCCHWWRYDPSLVYDRCHNTPTIHGRPGNDHIVDLRPPVNEGYPDTLPYMVHMGFAASERTRLAKHRYYSGRGERADPDRNWYVQSRQAWFSWRPGKVLPRKAEVIEYTGAVPECFLNDW